MAIIFYSFVQSTNNAHLRVLYKITDKLGVHNRNVLPHLLARLFLFEQEDLSTELYQFYFEHAFRGLHVQSPVTRTKCVSLLSYLSRVRLEPILPLLPILQKQNKDGYWELKGQLLILASNILPRHAAGWRIRPTDPRAGARENKFCGNASGIARPAGIPSACLVRQ